MKVPPLPFLVADADAVGDGQSQRVWLVSEVQQLELVQQRSPGRNIWLPEGNKDKSIVSTVAGKEEPRFPGMPPLAGEA